jgi:hypothetical protein
MTPKNDLSLRLPLQRFLILFAALLLAAIGLAALSDGAATAPRDEAPAAVQG